MVLANNMYQPLQSFLTKGASHACLPQLQTLIENTFKELVVIGACTVRDSLSQALRAQAELTAASEMYTKIMTLRIQKLSFKPSNAAR